ncbi:hypothetical protein RN001_010893 [Aquatica leii]|uniref:SCP domain-containing protein n=1 Tax=Aquatica leii TaxID=1421715 RepID=A0AAN7SER6_9COLE|nr:hypothetical protein RN001_010893 [Aquatica leii]
MLFFNLLLLVYSTHCKIYESGVNQDEVDVILKKHNDVRLLVAQGKLGNQPKASNLKRLKYDFRLAEEAQKIADSCIYAHSKVIDDRWKDVGQNLYRRVSKRIVFGTDWNHAIEKWFKEHEVYTYTIHPKPATAHYTQLVGAKTEYVGCGYSLCKAESDLKYTKLYVCNYGPFANYDEKYPYKAGEGCDNLC